MLKSAEIHHVSMTVAWPRACAAALAAAMETPRMALAPNLPKEIEGSMDLWGIYTIILHNMYGCIYIIDRNIMVYLYPMATL